MKKLIIAVLALWASVAQAQVTTLTNRITYTCSGGTAYAVTFPFAAASDLVVTKTTGAVVQTLVLGSDYTVSGGSFAVGSVTTAAPCSAPSTLTITRRTDKTQPVAFRAQGAFSPRLHGNAFDRLTMQAQELDRDRADLAAKEAADVSSLASINVAGTADPSVLAPLATGTGTRRTLAAWLSDTVNVLACGADPTGMSDSQPAFALAAVLVPPGGTIFAPAGTYRLDSTFYTGTSKPMRVLGVGEGTILTGTGRVIVALQSLGSRLEHLQVKDSNPLGDAATVGVDLSNGLTGVNEWSLDHVLVKGPERARGIGVRLSFALKGAIRDCNIWGWDRGVSVVNPDLGYHRNNAVEISRSTIHYNTVGLEVGQNAVDDFSVVASTLESNDTGLSVLAGNNQIKLISCHLEAYTGGAPTNVHISGGEAGYLTSIGNFYAGAAAGRDIVLDAGTPPPRVHSYSDTMNSGVTNGSSSTVMVYSPILASSYTGPAIVIDNAGFHAYGGATLSSAFTGIQVGPGAVAHDEAVASVLGNVFTYAASTPAGYAVQMGSGTRFWSSTLTTSRAGLGGNGANPPSTSGVGSSSTHHIEWDVSHLYLKAPATAPAQADLAVGQISFSLDETTHNLVVSVKYSDGSTRRGTVSLSVW